MRIRSRRRKCLRCVAESQIESGFAGDEAFLRIEGIDAKPHLRDEKVNRSVSPVSVVPAVRDCLTGHLRGLAQQRDVVVVGRDIGSVVFPDTPYKFYIDASQNVRQQRRMPRDRRMRSPCAIGSIPRGPTHH